MSQEYAIELQSLKKAFDEVIAVNDFTVNIEKGEFFSLLGPSGCGKTTTLRMIAGLETPTGGHILLEGKDVSTTPAYKRHVNTVFQDYALFPHMTVKKNIYFPLKMRKISPAEADPRIQNVLRLVNMEGFESRLPQQLSGGQRQRIALARSLVNEPAALLLDEPLGALDFKLRVAMQKVLKDIQRNVGITFIYVTHDQSEAMTMSDRIAVMKDGVVHQIGTPDDIYNRPETAFVASFIGDMNFVYGKLMSAGPDESTIEMEGHTIITKKPQAETAQGQDVLLCLRTERVQINSHQAVDNALQAKLTRIMFRGTDYEATCQVGEAEIRAIVAAVSWDHALQVGDTVEIGWNTSDVIVFPRQEAHEIIQYSIDAV
ncbi:polyamine ABC transporter ATP-binding protein [candidate division KSB3 bacterium]|uniref:Spermidine/putrescine import ATP-binding protein PotA n=1 Tax=candidate division KSB3 bacterium TaxID=2044937 RepID=A0A9D5JVP2_9BACT|nr:polyamine ABC transporter ATP-binding protein [candidate division KSB3 bacterium]MBD3324772.1 polyamine ABC transporter ATP-binding protein [candidate division KSB3 bacterium]